MNGRVILSGAIGAGKKVTAIAAGLVYRPEFPLVVVCAEVKILQWRDEFLKWIPRLNYKTKMQLIDAEDFSLNSGAQIFIVSDKLVCYSEKIQAIILEQIRAKVCILDSMMPFVLHQPANKINIPSVQ